MQQSFQFNTFLRHLSFMSFSLLLLQFSHMGGNLMFYLNSSPSLHPHTKKIIHAHTSKIHSHWPSKVHAKLAYVLKTPKHIITNVHMCIQRTTHRTENSVAGSMHQEWRDLYYDEGFTTLSTWLCIDRSENTHLTTCTRTVIRCAVSWTSFSDASLR